VEWRGLLVADETGTHRLRAQVDDDVAVWVNDVPVIEAQGVSGRHDVSGVIHLDAGLHAIRLRYVQRGGESRFRVSWSRPSSREEFQPLLVMTATDPPPLFRRIAKATAYPRQVATLWSLWVLVGLTLAGAGVLAVVSGHTARDVFGWRTLVLIAVVALPILGANLQIGLLPWRGWAPDEVLPGDVANAMANGFAGGWRHLYPPLSFYLLALIHLPFTSLTSAAWLGTTADVTAAQHALDRGLSLAYAFLTLLAGGTLAQRAFGAGARRLTPFLIAGLPLIAFYAKTTNVDMAYTFWVIVAALAWLGAMTRGTRRDHIILGATVAAAIATKDQAYGFFPGAALALVYAAWQRTASTADRPAQRLMRVVTDAALWSGLVTCLALYSVLLGVWWNLDGVQSHIAMITGPASVPFRMFPASPTGFATLLLTSLAVLGQTLGPLIVVAAATGLGVSISDARTLRPALLLLVLPVSYLMTFVGTVGYVYDRFLLAVVVFIAIFAARGIDWAMTVIRHARARALVTTAVMALALLPSVILNVRQWRDSRLATETWMQEHLLDDPLVLGVGSALYLPNLYPYQHRLVPSASVDELVDWAPDAIVFNEHWFERPGQPPARMVDRTMTEAGFTQVMDADWKAVSSRWLAPFLTALEVDPTYSNVAKVSPPLAIWMRAASDPTAGVERVPLTEITSAISGTIAFQNDREGRDKLYRLDLASRTVTAMTSGQDHRDEEPAWSPDGQRLAFSTTRFGRAAFDVAVLDVGDGSVRRVTSSRASVQYPAWTHDGRTLIVASEHEGTQAVFRLDIDSGEMSRLSPLPERALMPDVSPDGRRVAYASGTPDGLQIALQDIDGGGRRLLTRAPGESVHPRWSPDGTRVAMTRLFDSGSHVIVIDVASGATRALTIEGLAAVADPDWSPDGQWLAVAGTAAVGAGEDWDLYLIRAAGDAAAFRITTGRGQDRHPAWMPR
ncbi:MAG: PD40 domain-containing protein, partial [Acidobacteria bacterium]|nr:PD40 domain-containing protein [Acidobacteriota bacterium]